MKKTIAIFMAAGMMNVTAAHAAPERYNFLEDAAIKQAKEWQGGGKAKTVMSTDGKLIFPFGQTMPTLTCTVMRACDIEMEPGEHVQEENGVVFGDQFNWHFKQGVHMENGQVIEHVIIQPSDVKLETNMIIYTDKRSYHVLLKSPEKEGDYLNRIAFYYPSEMVTKWKQMSVNHQKAEEKEAGSNVLNSYVSPEKLDFGYRMEGSADFAPVRVFNDGERTYIEMPDNMKVSEHPLLYLRDEQNQVMVTNYRESRDPNSGKIHYVVDKLFAIGEFRIDDSAVQIIWKKKEKGFWNRVGLGK